MTVITSDELSLLRNRRWVALTGAGISQPSGIPTYRDASGIWLGSAPIKHQDFLQRDEQRKRYWARSALGWPAIANAQPNRIHQHLVQLEQKGLITGVITQNVDRLHQKAGQRKVIDLHGRLDRVRCLACCKYQNRERIQQQLLALNPFLNPLTANIAPDGDAQLEDHLAHHMTPVNCPLCNGLLMPDVVFFGGTVPKARVELAHHWLEQADGLMVLGSSLMVYSGFRFCKWVKAQGKPLVIINRGVTRADTIADIKMNHDCNTVLECIVQSLKSV